MEFNLIRGVPNDEIILLPVEWITENAHTIAKTFLRQNVKYILTKHMVVFTPAATPTIIQDIDGKDIISLGSMTNALNIDFPIEKISKGSRLIWTSTAALSVISVAYQKIMLK